MNLVQKKKMVFSTSDQCQMEINRRKSHVGFFLNLKMSRTVFSKLLNQREILTMSPFIYDIVPALFRNSSSLISFSRTYQKDRQVNAYIRGNTVSS